MAYNDRVHTVLRRMNARLERLSDLYEKMLVMFEMPCNSPAYETALAFAEEAEKLTLLARSLPEYTGRPSAALDVESMVLKQVPIEIGYTKHGWFCVRMPFLLPKKESTEKNYVRENLLYALKEFWAGRPISHFGKSILIYRHVYDVNRPNRQWRDHDNVEINISSDLVAFYTLPDDTPSFCNHYYCSAAGTKERTEIYVVPQEEFPLWMLIENSIPDEGEKLYEEAKKELKK